MTITSPSTPSPPRSWWTPGVARRLVQIGVLIIIQAAALFGAAGRLTWGAAWVYLGIYLAFIALNAVLVLPHGTGVVEERSHLKPAQGWDRIVMSLYSLSALALLVVAGLEERWGWAPPVGAPLQWAAGIAMGLGLGLFSWSMAANAYFAVVVRVQTERGHQVVTGGPYAVVRHPGYAGTLLFALAAPLLLDSPWALLPAAVLIGSLVARTALEDRTLRAELPGYGEYARRVRFRLLPGIW